MGSKATASKNISQERWNGAKGMSDIEGKVAR